MNREEAKQFFGYWLMILIIGFLFWAAGKLLY